MSGSPTISPIGPHAPNCWPKRERTRKPADAYEIAIGLEHDPAVRRFLQKRQAELTPHACRLTCQLGPCALYFESPPACNPRYFSIGSMLGGAPRHASYSFSRSSVLPRESTILRKRSPFARVNPPWSSNH